MGVILVVLNQNFGKWVLIPGKIEHQGNYNGYTSDWYFNVG